MHGPRPSPLDVGNEQLFPMPCASVLLPLMPLELRVSLAKFHIAFDLGSQALRGLNKLSGFQDSSDSHPSMIQLEVAARIFRLSLGASEFGKAPHGEVALRELLKGASGYEDLDGSHSTLAPFRLDRVALPDASEINDSPNIEDLLPAECLTYLEEDLERMMKPRGAYLADSKEVPIEPYIDPV